MSELPSNVHYAVTQRFIADMCGVTPPAVAAWMRPGGKLHGRADTFLITGKDSAKWQPAFTPETVNLLIAEGVLVVRAKVDDA